MMDYAISGRAVSGMVDDYVNTALWLSSAGADGEPLGNDYGPDDLSDDSARAMRGDVEAFVAWLEESVTDAEYASLRSPGHDLWLTRNGHGTGFWDRGYGALGDRLAEYAHAAGSRDLYEGDDGWVYVS